MTSRELSLILMYLLQVISIFNTLMIFHCLSQVYTVYYVCVIQVQVCRCDAIQKKDKDKARKTKQGLFPKLMVNHWQYLLLSQPPAFELLQKLLRGVHPCDIMMFIRVFFLGGHPDHTNVPCISPYGQIAASATEIFIIIIIKPGSMSHYWAKTSPYPPFLLIQSCLESIFKEQIQVVSPSPKIIKIFC